MSVPHCDRTERTDMPQCFTRIRYGQEQVVIMPGAMSTQRTIRPFFRWPGSFGFQDGGDAA